MCQVNKDFSLYFTLERYDETVSLPYPIILNYTGKVQCSLVECWLDAEWDNVPDGYFAIFNNTERIDLKIPTGYYQSIFSVIQQLKKAIPKDQRKFFSFTVNPADPQNVKIGVTGPKRELLFGSDLGRLFGIYVLPQGTNLTSFDLNWNRPPITISAPHLVTESYVDKGMKPILAVVPPDCITGKLFQPFPVRRDVENPSIIETLHFPIEANMPVRKKIMTLHLYFHISDE